MTELPVTSDPNFGRSLKEKRLKEGLSQEDAAAEIGVSKHTYGMYERNQMGFSFQVAIDISRVFDWNLEEMALEFDLTKRELPEAILKWRANYRGKQKNGSA